MLPVSLVLPLPSRRAGEEKVGDEPLSKDNTGGLPGTGQSPGLFSALMAQPVQG